ncbi:unnamed protein product [Thelazia callipaeda]|uniref:DB domain-containing protein n=1 Tax=Thelazia callipaeda TaxID=103827 RepID=A0A0N5CNR5_THECL|nr:unnamed protein product [Thelazia callipaeda]
MVSVFGILFYILLLYFGFTQCQLSLTNFIRPAVRLDTSYVNSRKLRTREETIADTRLRKCCAHLTDADHDCKTKYCSFDVLSSFNAMVFLSKCGSKGLTVTEMWNCASSRHDHTRCCQQSGVISNCISYCKADGIPDKTSNYTKCLKYLEPIKRCFQKYLAHNRNLFGEL